jgi:hypothetical protein
MTAFLCESATLPAHIEYLTLSHCWGRVPFLTLTEENIGQMKHSIPVDDLPKLFQDAMLTTLELGFNYLWIDSLCIIQNSPGSSDWLNESSKMDTVYRNSTCNIAATGFHDGQEGLLLPGDAREIFPPRVNFAHIWALDRYLNYYLLSVGDWGRDILSSPLLKRAWVCQEAIMVKISFCC